MPLPTYLDLVNDVLVRLREPEVATVSENTLSKLIGKLVNDSRKQVENAYQWNALTDTLIIETAATEYGYVLNGSGQYFKVIDVWDNTNKTRLRPIPTTAMNQYLLEEAKSDKPLFYNFNGVHTSGDTKVDLYPIPDSTSIIYFNVYISQWDLVNDIDPLLVPKEPVIMGAYARALVERGEDGGLNSSEAYALYRASLADAIAIESSRFIEEEIWEAV